MNRYAAVHAVACELYNVPSDILAERLFPGRHPTYLAELTERFERGFGYAVSKMDTQTFRRFVDDCIERHGANALLYHPDNACIDTHAACPECGSPGVSISGPVVEGPNEYKPGVLRCANGHEWSP